MLLKVAVWQTNFLSISNFFLLQGNLFFFCRFLIGREKPGTQSEVARLISETLEQERCLYEQHYVHDDTEQVKHHTYLHIFKST